MIRLGASAARVVTAILFAVAALAAFGGCNGDSDEPDGGRAGGGGSTVDTRPVDVEATARGVLPVLDRGPATTPEATDDLLQACIDLRRAAEQAKGSAQAKLAAAADVCPSRPGDAAAGVRAALGS